jgi:outer membrane receptor for ferrienterochelin and colicins
MPLTNFISRKHLIFLCVLSSTHRSKYLLLLLATLLANPVLPQEQAGSTVIYHTDYFAQFNPVSLADMIRNIPGGIAVLGGGGNNNNRGLGANDTPILIDGRRMAGKTNDMTTMLARILASQVERIELIRGNAEGLDIRNEGIIYNVVLRQTTESSTSNFIQVGAQRVRGTSAMPELLMSHSGQRDTLEYVLSYEYDSRPRYKTVSEDVLATDRTPTQFRQLIRDESEAAHIVTGSLAYQFNNGATVLLNGLYSEADDNQDRAEDQYRVSPSGDPLTLFAIENGFIDETENLLELGADIEFDVGNIGRLKTLFVYNRSDIDETISQEIISNGVTTPFFSSYSQFDNGETILRSTMNSTFGRHTLEYGAEAAYNTLDATFSFDNSPFQNAIVEEDRYEVFITYSTALSDKLNLQSVLTGEFSTIFQNREGETNSRSFEFLKPRVELRYDLTPSDQFRVLVERTVRQLDLDDFVASRNVDDDMINFGNPDLQPESTWTSSLGYERRFADDGGSLKMTLYYNKISNHIDKILIGDFDDASSGTGNIGDADRFGFDSVLNTRLGFLGLPTAVLTLTYGYKNSETIDPFTGETRQIKNNNAHRFVIQYRHDIENTKLAWGWSAHRNSGLRLRQDVALREATVYTNHLSIFGEFNFTPTIKARIEANHVHGDQRTFDKTFYDGHIANGVIRRIDVQRDNYSPDFLLSLQATF